MAKAPIRRQPTKPAGRRKTESLTFADLPLPINYLILGAGVAVIILGYIVMAAGDATSSLSVTIGPIILAVGYCVLIPLGILYKRRDASENRQAADGNPS